MSDPFRFPFPSPHPRQLMPSPNLFYFPLILVSPSSAQLSLPFRIPIAPFATYPQPLLSSALRPLAFAHVVVYSAAPSEARENARFSAGNAAPSGSASAARLENEAATSDGTGVRIVGLLTPLLPPIRYTFRARQDRRGPSLRPGLKSDQK